MRIEVWSDVVCPFCFIGKRRLERALDRFPHAADVEVVWRSFQLDPSIPEGTVTPTLPLLAAKYGRSEDDMRRMQDGVEEMAAGEGLEYHLADTLSGSTLLAHELLHHATSQGLGDAATERLMRAYFTENRDVFTLDALVVLAGEVGLDEDEARAVLTDRRYRDSVQADLAAARDVGVTGVPFFVVDRRYALAGAHPAEMLLRLLERAWSERVLAAAPSAGSEGATGPTT